jgi:hypothetical protein
MHVNASLWAIGNPAFLGVDARVPTHPVPRSSRRSLIARLFPANPGWWRLAGNSRDQAGTDVLHLLEDEKITLLSQEFHPSRSA